MQLFLTQLQHLSWNNVCTLLLIHNCNWQKQFRSNRIVKSCILKLFQNASSTRMNLKEEARHSTKLQLYSVFEIKYFDSNVPNEAKYLTEKNHSLLHLTPLLEICFFPLILQLFLMPYPHLSWKKYISCQIAWQKSCTLKQRIFHWNKQWGQASN